MGGLGVILTGAAAEYQLLRTRTSATEKLAAMAGATDVTSTWRSSQRSVSATRCQSCAAESGAWADVAADSWRRRGARRRSRRGSDRPRSSTEHAEPAWPSGWRARRHAAAIEPARREASAEFPNSQRRASVIQVCSGASCHVYHAGFCAPLGRRLGSHVAGSLGGRHRFSLLRFRGNKFERMRRRSSSTAGCGKWVSSSPPKRLVFVYNVT